MPLIISGLFIKEDKVKNSSR